MNDVPDFEVLLRTRTRIAINRRGKAYELLIGDGAYITVFEIPKNAADEMIENFKRSYPRRERGVTYGE